MRTALCVAHASSALDACGAGTSRAQKCVSLVRLSRHEQRRRAAPAHERASVRARAAVQAPPNVKSDKYAPLPAVPIENVHWVDDLEGLQRATAAVRAQTAGVNVSDNVRLPPCVGLDAEWRPGDNTPVALLQVATRDEVFLIDLLATAPRGCAPEVIEATDELLKAILWEEKLYKLGFSFGYDVKRMKASYSHLSVWDETCKNLVDVKQLAYAASPNKMSLRCGLAVLTRQVIGCMLDKKEQCSDWAKRPLTASQRAYAAADGYSLCLIFDKCLTMIKEDDDVLRILTEVVEAGEPLRGLPRKVKKVRVLKQKERAKAAKRGGQGKPCQFARETALEEANADILSALESVGRVVGGRKGAIELLAGEQDIRHKNDGRNVHAWANAMAVFVSVGKPQTRGPTTFWERDGEIYMKWDGKAGGALDEDIARLRRSKSSEVTKPVDGEGDVAGDSALLFIRRPPGQYMFCGRLENVGESSSDKDAAVCRLVDAESVRTSDTYFQLIGCRLSGSVPSDVQVV